MKIRLIARYVVATIFVLLLQYGQVQGQPPLASHKVYQYGGPASRTRCVSQHVISDNPITGKQVICNGWGTDFEQHALFLEWYAPKDVTDVNEETKTLANACLAASVALVLKTHTLVPATALAFLDSKLEPLRIAFGECVRTNLVLGKIAVKDFDIRVRQADFWEN